MQKKKTILREDIKQMVVEKLKEMKKQEFLNELKHAVLSNLNEDGKLDRNMDDRRKKDKEQSSSKKAKRDFVLSRLRDGAIKQSDAMRFLWNVKQGTSDDDVYRSLFSKMVTGTPDNDGVVRKFSDAEINKLAQYIHDIGA